MASSRVLLLLAAATLLFMASVVQVLSDDSPPPHPAPSLCAAEQCTNDYLSELAQCFPMFQGVPRPRNYDMEQCCQHVRDKPSAPDCLCLAFKLSDRDAFRGRAGFADYVNFVLINCEEPEAPGLACPAWPAL
uniref:Uncharacterized protein n=1 Tax=Avena sativa TaxID=4498 RepID=A0ACD5U089_AVESA